MEHRTFLQCARLKEAAVVFTSLAKFYFRRKHPARTADGSVQSLSHFRLADAHAVMVSLGLAAPNLAELEVTKRN